MMSYINFNSNHHCPHIFPPFLWEWTPSIPHHHLIFHEVGGQLWPMQASLRSGVDGLENITPFQKSHTLRFYNHPQSAEQSTSFAYPQLMSSLSNTTRHLSLRISYCMHDYRWKIVNNSGEAFLETWHYPEKHPCKRIVKLIFTKKLTEKRHIVCTFSVCACFPFQIFTALRPTLQFPALRWWMAWYPSLKERLLAPLSWQRRCGYRIPPDTWSKKSDQLKNRCPQTYNTYSGPTLSYSFTQNYVWVPFWSDVPPLTIWLLFVTCAVVTPPRHVNEVPAFVYWGTPVMETNRHFEEQWARKSLFWGTKVMETNERPYWCNIKSSSCQRHSFFAVAFNSFLTKPSLYIKKSFLICSNILNHKMPERLVNIYPKGVVVAKTSDIWNLWSAQVQHALLTVCLPLSARVS